MTAPTVTAAWSRNLRVTQIRVIRSEWTKLRSLRSTRWSMLAAIALTVGLPLAVSAVVSSHWGTMAPRERANRHPVEIALFGTLVAQLAIGVLGVLMISGEYSTGMIRATLGAVPKRLPALWAKAFVYAVTAFVLMLPSALLAFYGSQAILSKHQALKVSFSDPGVARAVVGAALYLTVVGVFAMAFGAITRNTAGGIACFAAIMFVIPPLLNVLPSSWNNAISPYMPGSAGSAVLALTHGSDTLAPWTGFALFCGYTALAVGVAAVLLVRRDA